MDQIIDFFKNLFSTSDWPPRWTCGKWTEFHGWLYIGSDVTIWLAYFIIPVIIFWFIQKHRQAQFLPIFWLFGSFILLCGATHIMDAIIFWWPGYRLSALIRFLTAIVSLATAFVLIKELPKTMEDDNQDEMDSIQKLKEQLAARYGEIESLQSEIAHLKAKK